MGLSANVPVPGEVQSVRVSVGLPRRTFTLLHPGDNVGSVAAKGGELVMLTSNNPWQPVRVNVDSFHLKEDMVPIILFRQLKQARTKNVSFCLN